MNHLLRHSIRLGAPPMASVTARGFASIPKSQRIIFPSVQKLLRENNLIFDQVHPGTGPSGIVTKGDVLRLIQSGGAPAAATKAAATKGAAASGSSGTTKRRLGQPSSTDLPNNNVRKTIAKRLTDSKQELPHYYVSVECDVTRLMKLRATVNEAGDVKTSLNDYIIRAAAKALKKHPDINVSFTEDSILQYHGVDISVAVATDGGLITPIVKDADKKGVGEISGCVKELAKKAREGTLQPNEYQGGMFSISNLGMYSTDRFTAIINPPQACILAVGTTVPKVVPATGEDGSVKPSVQQTTTLTISCDHRAVDGALAAQFMGTLKQYLQKPELMI
eukprot:GFYU01015836.1.p1 GENE.GFYU01015836.1~~GFYU01015836.1.p1  ORF type:complete len:335 (+),score=82.21 GFYU01015836.1:159-1163(+)